MPDGYTIKKLRIALDRVQNLRREADEDEDSRRRLETLGKPGGLAEFAAAEAELEAHEIEYLSAFPPRLIEAVRSVIHHAVLDENAPLIELQYLPGYAFEVRIVEYADQLTIHLRGPFGTPYPHESFVPKR